VSGLRAQRRLIAFAIYGYVYSVESGKLIEVPRATEIDRPG
jgi:hypothetical protein